MTKKEEDLIVSAFMHGYTHRQYEEFFGTPEKTRGELENIIRRIINDAKESAVHGKLKK